MRFRILGPLEVFDGDRPVVVQAAKLRALLAVLLLRANEHVPIDELIDRLWGDHPPANARRTLQVYVMRLRSLFGDGTARRLIRTRPDGYLLHTDPDSVDLTVFRRTVRQARETADPAERSRLLREADGLWRGAPLVDVHSAHLSAHVAPGLVEERLGAVELRLAADLELGGHSDVIADLRALVTAHPLRERLWAHLVLALWRSGRQADALAAYQDIRRTLADELGVDPGAELQRAHRTVLAGDEEPAASPPPHALLQLPLDLGDFVGRTELIEQVTGRLLDDRASTPVVVVSGPPGVGKTALAVRIAHRVRGRFPDGQLFVDLRGYDRQPPMSIGQALTQFLRTLGTPAEHIPLAVEEQAVLFRSMLSGRRVLVVLDNAASADQVRKLLPAGSGCAVLITSRDELRGLLVTHGARALALDVFAEEETTRLLSDMIGTDKVAAEPRAVAELARLCANLPLALRIAAANVAMEPTGSIAGYVAELRGSRLAALVVAGDTGTAVSSAFDLSYTALDPLAQRVFRLLSLVPGTEFGADTAAALAGVDRTTATAALRALAGAHLVQRCAAGRVRFHDLIRYYATERALAEDSEVQREAALHGLFEWYLRRAHGAADLLYPEMLRMDDEADPLPFDQPDDALAWLRAERSNLVAAIRHAAGPMAWLLTDALRGYFWIRTNGTDWDAAVHAGLRAAEAGGDLRAQVFMRHSLGTLHASFGNAERALAEYRTSLEIARANGFPCVVSAAHNNIGVLRQDLGQLDAAVREYEAALVVQRGLVVLRPAKVTTLVNLGSAYWEMGNLRQAREHFETARELLGDTAAHQARVEVQDSLARVYLDLGELDLAEEFASRALELADLTGHPRQVAEAHNTLGTLCVRRGRDPEAVRHHEFALRVAGEIGHRRAEAAALLGLACVAGRDGRYEEALRMCEQALALITEGAVHSRLGRVLTALAKAHFNLGNDAEALRHAEEAIAAHRRTGHRLSEARAVRVYAEAVARLSGEEEAEPHRALAAEIFAELGAPDSHPVPVLAHR
jgi:DNA-binding SARP family transcriptional activator/tetratricopeptide (TPR) repeat protein